MAGGGGLAFSRSHRVFTVLVLTLLLWVRTDASQEACLCRAHGPLECHKDLCLLTPHPSSQALLVSSHTIPPGSRPQCSLHKETDF
jgi:hypothetical protein